MKYLVTTKREASDKIECIMGTEGVKHRLLLNSYLYDAENDTLMLDFDSFDDTVAAEMFHYHISKLLICADGGDIEFRCGDLWKIVSETQLIYVIGK